LLAIVCIATWSGGLSFIYFYTCKKFGCLRLSLEDEILGGDIHYFAPKQMEGKISTYARGLHLTLLNSEYVSSKNIRKYNGDPEVPGPAF
jgi:hypothetical protein